MTLRITDLFLQRADGVPLLGPLCLRVAPGERVGLVGESGSGKSLLAHAIFGVLPPGVQLAGGSLRAWGIPLERPGRDSVRGRRLAWVPQDPLHSLNPFLNVREHLNLLPRVHLGEGTGATLARLAPLLAHLRLPSDRDFLARRPHELSGGQRQRLLLAQALSCDPDLLVLDEPTTALDPTAQADFADLVQGLQAERGLGVLWISHDLPLVAGVTDRLLVLYGGQALEAGPTFRLLGAPRHPYTQRLRAAVRREPSLDGGFLPAPGERPPGCPFQPRCPEARPSCAAWSPWRGSPEEGLRCEARDSGP